MDEIKTNNITLIFDFDGTLANTFDLVVEAVNSLSSDYGFEQVLPKHFDYLRGLPAHKVLKLMGVSWYRIPELIIKVQRYMKSRMHNIHMYPGIADAIVSLKAAGFSLGIITSNSRENVDILLDKHRCNEFSFIHSARHVFGKSKALKTVIKQRGMDKQLVYYIGDETRDIDAAKLCGIKSISVTWGFNKKELLIASDPYALVDHVDDLKTKLLSFI